jgi:hypothetical protein
MDFVNDNEIYCETDFFSYKNNHKIDFIFKNNKTFLYESFDTDGHVKYKMVLVNQMKNYYFFKKVNEDIIIRYDIKNNELHEIKLIDYYLNNFSQFILFDKKKIIIN